MDSGKSGTERKLQSKRLSALLIEGRMFQEGSAPSIFTFHASELRKIVQDANNRINRVQVRPDPIL